MSKPALKTPPEPTQGVRWHADRRGSRFMTRLLAAIALRLGRPVARLILWPTVLYFFLTAPQARRASADYLRRALGRTPTPAERLRHFHAFAAVALDRVFLLTGRHAALDVCIHGADCVRELAMQRRGAILMVAHVGSFEVLRAAAATSGLEHLRVRILMDRARNPAIARVLEALNPALLRDVIDTSGSDVDRVLRLSEAIARGEMVGLMADRLVRADERAVPVSLLGGRALLPASPWLLAAVLRAPVILCFGLYLGGRRYDLHFEPFADPLVLPRARREAALAECMQRYADRLSHHLRIAPMNWFNFYPFWDGPAR